MWVVGVGQISPEYLTVSGALHPIGSSFVLALPEAIFSSRSAGHETPDSITRHAVAFEIVRAPSRKKEFGESGIECEKRALAVVGDDGTSAYRGLRRLNLFDRVTANYGRPVWLYKSGPKLMKTGLNLLSIQWSPDHVVGVAINIVVNLCGHPPA
jgi:hypothetical protein